MSKMTAVLVVISTLALAVVGVQASEGEGGAHRKHNPEKMIKKMSRRLDLTESQQKKVAEMLDAIRGDTRENHGRIREIRQEMRKISLSTDPDALKVRKLVNELGELTAEMAYTHTMLGAEFNRLLTPEQQEKLRQLQAKRL